MANSDSNIELTASRSLLRSLVPDDTRASLVHTLVRADDQLRVCMELVNGTIENNIIVALRAEESIFYRIWFGAQHAVEEPLGGHMPSALMPQAIRSSGESRVVIEVPDGTPFTVGTLLDLASFTLVLDARANRLSGKSETETPAASVTAVEMPASLVLSPTPGMVFDADTHPHAHGNITELWHARLRSSQLKDRTSVRAIWNRSDELPDKPPFEHPVSSINRDHLVNQSTGRNSAPISVNQLWLSSQGGFLQADGAWDNAAVRAYQHRVVTGRDVHVEVVEAGYLAPFGHPASITTVTERRYVDNANGEPTAVTTQEDYLSITTPTIGYPVEFMPADGRAIPFTQISASDPGRGVIGRRRINMPNGSSIQRRNAHIVTRDGAAVRIDYTATDRAGQGDIRFDLPVIFVAYDTAHEPNASINGNRTAMQKLKLWYQNVDNSDFSEAELHGQSINWAPPGQDPSRSAAGSVQSTQRIRFRLDRPDTSANDAELIRDTLIAANRPAFYPSVAQAWLVDAASATVLGGNAPDIVVTVAQRYLDHGVSELNVDLGYLDVVLDIVAPEPPTLSLPDNVPGLLSTGLSVDTFGQFLGAGKRTDNNPADQANTWNAEDALAGVLDSFPRLLGVLNLPDLIPDIDLSGLHTNLGLPGLTLEVEQADDLLGLPEALCFDYLWEPGIQSFPRDAEKKTFIVTKDFDEAGIPTTTFGENHTRLAVHNRVCVPGEATSEIALERFALQVPPLLPVVAILFDRVRIHAVNDDVSVDTELAEWIFINQLGWLDPVRALLLDTLGLGAPSFQDGIHIAFDLPVPNITLGVVGVHGISVGLAVDLPDTGSSSVFFAMSSVKNPFTITVFGFGGNGSFSLTVDGQRILRIEGSLAVTFELAVDVFLAAASVSVSLGAYVLYEDDEVEFGAYAEIKGSLSFIGLVKITGSVHLALLYNLDSKRLRGVAAVTGEVSSPFGKDTVTHDVEVVVALDNDTAVNARLVAAADNDGTQLSFQDRYNDTQWAHYCSAFVTHAA